jgi:hypothetical protein
MIERIKYILTSIIGEDKEFIICKYIGEFDIDVYSQITILALNVDKSKMILESEDIESHIKNILSQVQESKKLFRDELTRTLILENPQEKIKQN